MSMTNPATVGKPSCFATRMLRTIDRPDERHRRPNATVASMIYCTFDPRWSETRNYHPSVGTPDEPVQRKLGPLLSDGPTPGIRRCRVALRNRSTPVSPSRDMPGRSVGTAVRWQLVELLMLSRRCAGWFPRRYTPRWPTRPEWLTAAAPNTPCRVLGSSDLVGRIPAAGGTNDISLQPDYRTSSRLIGCRVAAF